MAERNYLVGESIPLRYQAPNKESGLSGANAPIAEILLNNAPVSGYDPVSLIEVGTSGNYVGSFIPDQEGEWSVLMHKADGDGQFPKAYSVGGHNVHSVGEAVDTVDGRVVGVSGKLDAVETKIDALDSKVGALDTPPVAY